ncbi:MAG: HNH endonuclease family protein [Kineosporiaceae bacterium]
MPGTMRRRPRDSARALVVVAMVFAVLAGFGWWLRGRGTPVAGGRPAPARTASAPVTPSGSGGATLARDALSRLVIRPKEPLTGYSRSAYGAGWLDPDGNGCDTRNDVLRRDLTQVQLRPGSVNCIVERGTLHDPYTGAVVAFERGRQTSGLVNIDHVVPLGNAWRTGARHWTAVRRTAFYNDPLELLAVQDSTNAAKDGSDAATWLPPRPELRCAFVARVIAVKARYGLWMTQAEHDAVATVLAGCPSQLLPTG